MNIDIDIIGIEHQTQKAILFNCEGSKQFWCPKAMIVDLHEDYVTVYSNFKFNYIYKEKIEDDFDELFEEIKEEPIIIKKQIKDIADEDIADEDLADEDLDWLLDPNWKPKAVYYNGVRIK